VAEPTGVAGPAATAAQLKARPKPPAEPATRQRAAAALFLALLSLFGLLGLHNLQRGIYIVAFTLVAGAMAIWLAVTSLRAASRRGTASPRGSVAAIVLAVIGVVISGFLLIGLAAFGRQVTTYSRCLSGANTVVAQQACQSQFVHAVEGASSGG
jgi:hypothetical protein